MKKNILFGLTALSVASLPISVQADSDAVASPGNALVGPLFYTPLERDAIDRGSSPAQTDGDSAGANRQAPPTVLRFNGRVERSAGRTTAWISGKRLEQVQPALPETKLRLQGERLRIETPRSTRWLKAGEKFEPDQAQPTDSKQLEALE